MLDGTVAAIWYCVNVGMIAGLWKLVRRWCPDDSLPQSLLHLLVLLACCIVLVSLILGTVGVLSPFGLGAGCAVIAAASLTWRRASLNAVDPVLLPDRDGAKPWERKTWLLVWGGIASLLAGIIVIRGVLEFPNDWDSLMYHIPLIDLWRQTGSLYVPQNPAWYNAGNAELLGFWVVAPFSGDFWIGLANVPVALLVVLGTLEFGRQLDLTLGNRQLCTIAVVASAVFLKEIRTTENDIAVLGFFVAALAYGIRYVRSDRLGDLLLAAACLGLLAGVKYYALGYTAVAWAAVFLLAFRQRGRGKALKVVAAGIAAISLLAGYWYVRNFFASGTPFFPLGLTDRTNVLADVRPGTWYSTLMGNGRLDLLPQVVTAVWNMTGPCHAAALLTLPVTVAYLIASAWMVGHGEETKALKGELRWLLLSVLLGTIAVFGITPFVVDPASPLHIAPEYRVARFSLCLQAAAILALGRLVSDASRWAKSLTLRRSRVRGIVLLTPCGVFAALVVAQSVLVARSILEDDWLEIALVGMDFCLLGVILARVSANMEGSRRAVGAAVGAIAVGCMAAWQANWWHRDFAQYYDRKFHQSVFSQLEELDSPRPQIAVMGYRSYPFFGSRRQFRVFRPRRIISEEGLYGYLRQHPVGIVAAISRYRGTFPKYKDVNMWLRANPEMFDSMDVGGRFDVYRIRQTGTLTADASLPGRPTRTADSGLGPVPRKPSEQKRKQL